MCSSLQKTAAVLKYVIYSRRVQRKILSRTQRHEIGTKLDTRVIRLK